MMETMRWDCPMAVATAAATTATISGAMPTGSAGCGAAADLATGAVAAAGSGMKMWTNFAVKAQIPQRMVRVAMTMTMPARWGRASITEVLNFSATARIGMNCMVC